MQQNKLNFKSKYEARAHIVVSLIKNKLTNEDIQQDLEVAEKMCDDLYLPFDDDIPISVQNKWDTDYFYYQIGCAKLIFSKERIYHILEVRQYLHDQGAPELQYIPPCEKSNAYANNEASTSSNQPNNGHNLKKIVIGGVVVVIVVAVLVKIMF